jgi:heme exporter protein B
MMLALRQLGVLIWKDVVIDLRRKENLVALFFFALLTLLLFNFALTDTGTSRYRITARTLEALEQRGVPAEAVGRFRSLVGRSFSGQAELLQALDALRGERATTEERIALLELGRRSPARELAAGLLWVTFLLAGVLSLGRSFGQERENGCMEGLLLTPVGRGVLYLGKMGSNAVFLLAVLTLLLPLFALFFQVPVAEALGPLAVLLLAGVLGYSALGTLLGGVTATLRGKEVLLPLLLFPLLVPLLVVVVQLTEAVLEGEPLARHAGLLQFLGAYDAIFLIVSLMVFEHVVES